MQLSIIIVNWNSLAYLRKCVASIHAYTSSPYEVIVVDNASPDGDGARIRDEFPEVILIQSERNLGFAGANNLGFRAAQGQYAAFVNPDTELLNPALDIMLGGLAALPGAGVMGCKLFNEDLSLQTSCVQTYPTILNQVLDSDWLRSRTPRSCLWGTRALANDAGEPSAVEVVSGACMVVKREAFERVGLFTEDYFMYAEDLDLCYKLEQAGCRNYYLGSAHILHYGGKSSNFERATQMKWRSIATFCTRHYGRGYGLAFRTAIAAAALLRLSILNIAGGASSLSSGEGPRSMARAKWRLILETMLRMNSSPAATVR